MTTSTIVAPTQPIPYGATMTRNEIFTKFLSGDYFTFAKGSVSVTQINGNMTLMHYLTPIAVRTRSGRRVLINTCSYGPQTKGLLTTIKTIMKRMGYVEGDSTLDGTPPAMGQWHGEGHWDEYVQTVESLQFDESDEARAVFMQRAIIEQINFYDHPWYEAWSSERLTREEERLNARIGGEDAYNGAQFDRALRAVREGTDR